MAWTPTRACSPSAAPAPGRRRGARRVAVALVLAAGIGLSACGGSGALPLSAAEHLPAAVRGTPGSGSWCAGLQKTAGSMTGLDRGESLGIAARIVRNDEHRVLSALHGLARGSGSAAALREAARTARRAASELVDGRNAGLTEAGRAASQITAAISRLGSSAGAAC